MGSGVTSFLSKPSTLGRTSSLGLWSPMQRNLNSFDNDEDEDDNNLTLNFSHEKHATPSATLEIQSTSVIETGANDVYRVRVADGSDLLLPALDDVVISIDLVEGRIVVDPPPWR